MESIDYLVNIGVGQTQNLERIVALLDSIPEKIARINSMGVSVGGGFGGGGGGGYGVGGGGGFGGGAGPSVVRSVSASARGASGIPAGSFDPVLSDMYDAFGESMPMPPAAAAEAQGPGGRGARGQSNWSSWSRISGINAMAYAIEDAYMGGIGGAVNNLPFAAQGLASQFGFDPMQAMGLVAPVALASTFGYMAYRNREDIFRGLGVQDSMTRENSILGVAQRSAAERAQKVYDDAAFYADRYGRGSDIGRSYMGLGAEGLIDMQIRSGREVDADRLAGFRLASTPGESAAADRLGALSVSQGSVRDYFLSRSSGDAGLAERNVDARYNYSDPIRDYMFGPADRNAEIRRERERLAQMQAAESANSLTQAFSGDPDALAKLREEANRDGTSPERKAQIQSVITAAGRMTTDDAVAIQRFRSAAGIPNADIEGNLRMIRGRLDGIGLSNEDRDALMAGMRSEMEAESRGSMTGWQERLANRRGQMERNIGAAIGGIELNSRSGRVRGDQTSVLANSIFQDLVANGVPPAEAQKRAAELMQGGMNQYRGLVNANGGNAAGFMMSLDEEQQAAFQAQNMSWTQLMIAKSAQRRAMLMQMTRRGLRGVSW